MYGAPQDGGIRLCSSVLQGVEKAEVYKHRAASGCERSMPTYTESSQIKVFEPHSRLCLMSSQCML